MNKVLGRELLNRCQVSEGRELVDDVGGDAVLDHRAVAEVGLVQASRNVHHLAQDSLETNKASFHLSHVKHMYWQTIHLVHELKLCIQITRRRIDLMTF